MQFPFKHPTVCSLFYFSFVSWGQVIRRCRCGRDRKATAEDARFGPPRARGRGQRRASGSRLAPPARGPLGALPPRTSSALFLLEVGPKVEKLDLSCPGQRLLLYSQGTQRLAGPYSQEWAHPPTPHLKAARCGGKWALMRSGVELGSLIEEGGRAHQGGPPRLLPPAAQLLALSSGQHSSSLWNLRGAASRRSPSLAAGLHRLRARTYPEALSHARVWGSGTQVWRAGTPHSFTDPASRAGQ